MGYLLPSFFFWFDFWVGEKKMMVVYLFLVLFGCFSGGNYSGGAEIFFFYGTAGISAE